MDNTFNSTPKSSHGGRAFLGFLLTFFITIFFIVQGLTISVKSSLLKGDSITSTLESMGFFDTLQELVVSEISESTKDINLSDAAIDVVFSKDTISNISEVFTEAIIEGKEVDISFIKDDCMNITKSVTSSAVDSVFKDFEDSSKTLDISSIVGNSSIKQLEEDYGISVTETIEDTISSKFGTTTMNLGDIDSNEIKKTVDDALVEVLYPTIDAAFDTYCDDVNTFINDSINDMNSDYNMNMIFESIDDGLKVFSLTNIIIIITSILFIGLEILLYRKELHRGLRNVAIASLISGILFGIITLAVTFIKDLIFSNLDTFDKTEKLIKDFFEKITDDFSTSILIIFIVYIVIAIGSFIASSVFKTKERNNASLM